MQVSLYYYKYFSSWEIVELKHLLVSNLLNILNVVNISQYARKVNDVTQVPFV